MSAFLRRSSYRLQRLLAAGGLSLFVTSMNGCDGISWNEASLASAAKAKGEIRVLTLQHPLVDDVRLRGPRKGLERELLQHFAKTYDLELKFISYPTPEALMTAFRNGQGEVAAGRFWADETRRSSFLRGPVFEETELNLFCQRRLKVQHISDLKNRRVSILAKDNFDSIDNRLSWLVPEIQLTVEKSSSLKSLFTQLENNKLDCVFAERVDGLLHSRLAPKAERLPDSMAGPRGLRWLVRNDRPDLVSLMHAWFQRASRDNEILRLMDHHQAHLSELNHKDTHGFLRRYRETFPQYRHTFLRAANAHNLDWRWVAAVAYQESHWNPAARSFTGVRGIMQLTIATAQAVGINDRTDPEQSIWGGSYYLRFLLNKMPRHLETQERMALALAAYNSGLGNLKAAQSLAQERGLNPNSWKDLKKVFPLLEDPEIARNLPFGPARGRETVEFVERVRGFYSLLHLKAPTSTRQ